MDAYSQKKIRKQRKNTVHSRTKRWPTSVRDGRINNRSPPRRNSDQMNFSDFTKTFQSIIENSESVNDSSETTLTPTKGNPKIDDRRASSSSTSTVEDGFSTMEKFTKKGIRAIEDRPSKYGRLIFVTKAAAGVLLMGLLVAITMWSYKLAQFVVPR